MVQILGRRRFGSRRWEANFVHGGGSRTAAIFAESSFPPRPVICVVDSDRKHPGAALGATAQAVLSTSNDLDSEFCRCFVLDSRELENYIPVELIGEVYRTLGDREQEGKAARLIMYRDQDQRCQVRKNFLAYLDYKDGIKPSDITHNDNGAMDIITGFWRYANPGTDVPENFDDAACSAMSFSEVSKKLMETVCTTVEKKPHVLGRMNKGAVDIIPHIENIASMLENIIDICAAPARLPIRI